MPKALQDLYLRLLSERSFKRAFAACYTANYGALARAHCEAALPNEERHRGVSAREISAREISSSAQRTCSG